MSSYPVQDLVVLTACKDSKSVLETLLKRRAESLAIRRISFQVYSHQYHDPAVFKRSHIDLLPHRSRFRYALVVLDREGSGIEERKSASDMEDVIRENLSRSGWDDRADAVVLDPELEIWIWADSPHVGKILGWTPQRGGLRSWLEERGQWPKDASKPINPKESLELVLRETQKRRSSSYYAELARSVGLEKCRDRAFIRLKDILRRWFPLPGEDS